MEKTRDRVQWQQIDRSENDNRTQARGTKIATGTTSADGWATIPAKRQVARMKMRVGQNDGPLPFEAITSFDEPIICFVHELARQRATTVTDVFRRTGQRKERGFKNRRTSRAFFATKRRLLRTRVTITGILCNSFYEIRKSGQLSLDKENQEGGASNLLFHGETQPTQRTQAASEKNDRQQLRPVQHETDDTDRPANTSPRFHALGQRGLRRKRNRTQQAGKEGERQQSRSVQREVTDADEPTNTSPRFHALGQRGLRRKRNRTQRRRGGEKVTMPVEEPRTATTL